MKPMFRWAGSKRQILRKLRCFWVGDPARYIEPFAGSASLFFDIQPREAVLGDLNAELICAMRAVQQDPYRVLECLRRLPKGKKAYYEVRAIEPERLAEYEIAARFFYLNRYCFNGLYRTNARGNFNVPYGPPKSNAPQDETGIIEASRALQGVLLVNGDFQATLVHARTGDFVYLDPPYVTTSRRVFNEYLPGSFKGEDLERLGLTLQSLHKKKIKFVITYADSPEARSLLDPWNPRRIRVHRNIAGFSGHRRDAYELLATNLN